MNSKPNNKRKNGASGLDRALESQFFKRFMTVAYGLGASIVIIGALFKITHIPGANEALFIGMVTEAIIFALSALQRPHVEPDWSKVHPELQEDYHGEPFEGEIKKAVTTGGQVNKLDEMLQEADINQETIARLGSGLKNLSESTAKMNNMAKASVANDEFVEKLNGASKSVSVLSESYTKTSKALDQELAVSGEFSSNVKSASAAAANLKDVYTKTSETLKEDIEASQVLSKSITSASDSAKKLAESYIRSSESIMKNIEELGASTAKNTTFNNELKKLSDNLSSLNTLYELQLKTSQQQQQSSAKLQESMAKLLADMEKSSSQTATYQKEMENLTRKMSSLNGIYGNMLSAMNVK
jgi:gliding motility-associated protein GldL